MNEEIDLYPQQEAFVFCEDRFTGFIGGIASGKSFAGAVKAMLKAEDKSVGLVVAPTYPMLRDAALRSLLDLAGERVTLHKAEMIVKAGPSEILFRSADDPNRLRGPNISWAWIDEASMCPPGTWEIVIGRLREGGKAGDCWVTTTPKGRNWLYERQGEMTVFRARTQDNPYLSPEFVRSLEASYAGKFALQELGGEFVGFEGLVYEEFDRGVHVQNMHNNGHGPFVSVVAGVDEGYTNPAVVLVVGIDNDGRAHVLDEVYKRRMLQGDVVSEAKRMRDQYGVQTFYADPSAAGLIAEMRMGGLLVQAADNEVYPGIQTVKARLAVQGDGKTRLSVSPACANTIAEFESYCWRESRLGMKDEPEKVNDHAMDALRYALASLERPGPLGLVSFV